MPQESCLTRLPSAGDYKGWELACRGENLI